MILQRDIRLRKEIKEDGCYLMCLLYIANKYTNTPLSPQRINGTLWYKFLQDKFLDANCFIRDPGGILRAMGLKADYTGVHEKPTYPCKANEVEILYFEGPAGGHFVCGDGRGNVTYDPWGVSRAVTEGRLVSKRIFRLG
jgi:hypothetical protein